MSFTPIGANVDFNKKFETEKFKKHDDIED